MPPSDPAPAMVGDTATGSHLLHIEGYSHTKSLPVNDRIESQSFTVGGRTWRLRYYPGGRRLLDDVEYTDCIAIAIVLDDSIPERAGAEARFFLLDRAGNEMPAHTQTTGTCDCVYAGDGFEVFFKREVVELPECLADDCFKVRCDISVSSTGFHGANMTPPLPALDGVPPPDLHQHLGDLLFAKEGADVTFQVAGETFAAHRCILAARSPVFKAELFGAMRESATTDAELCVMIDDMVPNVFGALLHFIYTDSLSEMTGQEEEVVMAQHLLEAADRYDMQRLKLKCEEKLCRTLDTPTAATTFVLAEQHHSHGLKKACIEFFRSPQALKAVMETDGFELIRSYPTLLEELISKVNLPIDIEGQVE